MERSTTGESRAGNGNIAAGLTGTQAQIVAPDPIGLPSHRAAESSKLSIGQPPTPRVLRQPPPPLIVRHRQGKCAVPELRQVLDHPSPPEPSWQRLHPRGVDQP